MASLKRKYGPINYRALAINALGELVNVEKGLDERIVRGYLVTWGTRNSHGEKFVKGAFAKSIQERGPESGARMQIKFLNCHRIDQACANFRILREDDTGLYFETEPLDDVSWANDLLVQLRSGTVNNFSIGWDYVWDKMEWDDSDDSLVVYEGILFEGSAVALASDDQTYAIRARSSEEETLHDAIEAFINILPGKDRLLARKLFAEQKSLTAVEPRAAKVAALQKRSKPTEKQAKTGINFAKLSKHI